MAPSSFTGVHGLAIGKQDRLLAGSVVGSVVDVPEGQADDFAVSPNGETAWTNDLQCVIRCRENDQASSRGGAPTQP